LVFLFPGGADWASGGGAIRHVFAQPSPATRIHQMDSLAS